MQTIKIEREAFCLQWTAVHVFDAWKYCFVAYDRTMTLLMVKLATHIAWDPFHN